MIPLMSCWPDVYNRILNKEKLLEYRRTFPKNCTHAYMYISSPVKAICGIVYFDSVIKLEDLKGKYSSEVDQRIDLYSSNYLYAGTIKSVQKIKPIPLQDLRENVPGFTAPQSYLYVDNFPILKNYIENNIIYDDEIINNNLTNIIPNKLCR